MLSFEDFVQRVRRYRRRDVIEAVANASIELTNAFHGLPSTIDPSGPIQQFALAAIAKVAIVSGNDHRSELLTGDALRGLCGALISVEEPILAGGATDFDLDSFLVRTAFEQFPFQLSPFEDLSRTLAMLEWSARESEQDVITPAFWSRVLGCTLAEFVGLALLMNIGALTNGGVFDPGWTDQPNFQPILRHLDRGVIDGLAPRHFIANVDDFRAESQRHQLSDRYLRRFEFNSLTVWPFVELPNLLPRAPIPRLILSRATPNGLYYLGAADSGPRFTDALGSVFETYVGNQLKLSQPTVLLHDVEYERGLRAADYVAVFDDAVLIVEAKATPLTAESRLGGLRLTADLERALGKGKQQVLDTAALIRRGHPAFAEVPPSLRQIGLVVTMEPYFQANSSSLLAQRTSDIPVMFGAARELEYLVSLDQETAVEALLRIVSDESRRRWNLGNALGPGGAGRNKILDEAWAAYPFGSEAITL